jgi:hypothetical protein
MNKIKYYTGIGSRETPLDILRLMTKIALYLQSKNYILRSGGAYGADSAFSKGCHETNKEIYVPWHDYNNLPLIHEISSMAFDMAATIHPKWDKLTTGVKALMARNCMQILGPNLDSPSEFVICWTPDKCIHENERTSKTGGTGQAIALANKYNIPIFNLARDDHFARFNFLKS